VELRRVGGSTAVVRRLARSPLKLLTPRGAGGCAHVVASTYGGGLLGGDEVALRVTAGAGTRCVLGTQASTKVYRSTGGLASRQSLDAEVGAGAILAVAPDPVTCFAGARYEQRQHFRLDAGASLLLIDWFTSGRAACGERWAFDRYRSETRVDVGGTCVAREALLLDAADAPVAGPFRTGRYDCVATAWLMGAALAEALARLLEQVARTPVGRRAPLVAAASPIKGGAVLRVVGCSAEAVGRYLTGLLAAAWTSLGDDPWSRKW
jgi:urease accessory protein